MNRARNYAQLRKAIDARRIELGLRMRDVDVDAKIADGYFATLMCGTRNFGPKSLGAVLRALSAEILIVAREKHDVPENRNS
jgi:hypothetical protein